MESWFKRLSTILQDLNSVLLFLMSKHVLVTYHVQTANIRADGCGSASDKLIHTPYVLNISWTCVRHLVGLYLSCTDWSLCASAWYSKTSPSGKEWIYCWFGHKCELAKQLLWPIRMLSVTDMMLYIRTFLCGSILGLAAVISWTWKVDMIWYYYGGL